MSVNDWYPFNTVEWRRDTYHLNVAQRGIYRELIDEYMLTGKPLPDHDASLAGISRATAAEWDAHKETIRAFFKARDGKLYLDKPYCRPAAAPARPSGEEWKNLRLSIFYRDNFTCHYCGEAGGVLECDHIIPVSRGGSHEPENLTTACFTCNRSKRDKLVEEWQQ